MKKHSIALSVLLVLAVGHASAQNKIFGGMGYFSGGYANYDMAALNNALPASYPTLGNHMMSFGGEGFAILNRFVIGGGGYGASTTNQNSDTARARADIGGGAFKAGYVLLQRNSLLVYPVIGIGGSTLAVVATDHNPYSFDDAVRNRAGATTLTLSAPTLSAELNLLKLIGSSEGGQLGYGGFGLGLKLGYQYSFPTNNWHFENKTYAGGPEMSLSGWYATLLVGGGGFGVK